MYVVTGATGNTGRAVAEALIAEGKQVRAVGRNEEKLRFIQDLGAEIFVADLADTEAMAKAFTGAESAYLLIPPKVDAVNMRDYQNEVIDSLTKAVKASDLSHIVALSSIGADKPAGVGPVNGLHDMEQKFSQIENVNILFLRPGYFMENLLGQVGMIKNMGFAGASIDGDVKVGMIATHDIGSYAASRLLRLDFSGKSSQDLQGQRDISYNEVTKILGKAIEKPDLKFVKVPDEQMEEALRGMGISADVAASFSELSKAIESKWCRFTERRSKKNTTPTSIEEFSKTFIQAFNA